MALPSSGTISLNDIYNEAVANGYAGNNTLSSLIAWSGWADLPGGADQIRDFLGVSATPPSYYINLPSGSYLQSTYVDTSLFNTDVFSINMWIKLDVTPKRSLHLFSFGDSQPDSNQRFALSYFNGNNRLALDIRYGAATVQRREWYLHADRAGITGINDYVVGWCASQRGTVDSDLFTMITTTVNRVTNSYEIYWNGSSLGLPVVSSPSTYGGNILPTYIGIGCPSNYPPASQPTTVNVEGGIDEVKLYNRILTSAEVTTLWNAGKVDSVTAGVTSGLITEWNFEQDDEDTNNLTNMAGTLLSYTSY